MSEDITAEAIARLGSQRISHITGVSRVTIDKYFNGERNPTYKSLQKLSEKLGVNTSTIIKAIEIAQEQKRENWLKRKSNW